MSTEKDMYERGLSIYNIAEQIGLSPTGVWKRLKKQGVIMNHTTKGQHWAIGKRGKEYLGSDGRYWVRDPSIPGKKKAKRRSIVVMEIKLGGPIPKGYHVHHKDENITNDDPDNLKLLKNGDHNKHHHKGKSNLKKGRTGELNHTSKLTWERVRMIRKVYATGKYTQQQIADKLGVSQTTIGHIVTNRTWRE